MKSNQNKFIQIFAGIFLAISMWLVAVPAFAQFNCDDFFAQFQIDINGKKVNTVEGLPKICSPEVAIGNVIQLMLQFSAVIAVLFIILGGYWYLTAAGNEEQSEKGRKALTSAIIGLVVIILAFALVRISVDLLTNGLAGGGTGTTNNTPGAGTGNQTNGGNTGNGTTVPGTGNGGTAGGGASLDQYGLTAAEYAQYGNQGGAGSIPPVVWSWVSSGLNVTSQISADNKSAIGQMEALCNRSYPPVLSIKISYPNQQAIIKDITYSKSGGNFTANLNDSLEKDSNADSIQFLICGNVIQNELIQHTR